MSKDRTTHLDDLRVVKTKKGRTLYFRHDTDKQVCGAKLKNPKEDRTRCPSSAMPNGRCRIHGGCSPSGPAHGRFRNPSSDNARAHNQKLARRLGELLGERFAETYKADDLMDLRRPVAALETVALKQAERIAERDTPEFRRRAVALFESAATSQRRAQEESEAGDADAAQVHAMQARNALQMLGKLLRRGADENETETVYANTVDKAAKQIERAWRTALSASQVVSTSEFDRAVRSILSIIAQETINNPSQQAKIVGRIDHEIFFGRLLDPVKNADLAPPEDHSAKAALPSFELDEDEDES